MEKSGNSTRERDEQLRSELSLMLSDLNEVRMRLDAVVRRLSAGALGQSGEGAEPGEEFAHLQQLRARLSSQLDRIREKLLARMPERS